MAYTNKTANYNLPQYIADDKPKYLTDFNTAMELIDTAIKGVSDTVSTVDSNVTEAINTATDAETLANTANTTANTANTQATTNHNILLAFFEGFNNIDEWTPST